LDLLEFSGTGSFFNGLYAKDSRSITGGGEMELLKSLRIFEAFRCKQIAPIRFISFCNVHYQLSQVKETPYLSIRWLRLDIQTLTEQEHLHLKRQPSN